MNLFDAFSSSAAARQTEEIAQQVARRSCAAVWQKVQGRVLAMSEAQARGYIHAHAADVVAAEAARSGASIQRQQELAPLARAAVVQTLVGEVARIQRAEIGRRRAA